MLWDRIKKNHKVQERPLHHNSQCEAIYIKLEKFGNHFLANLFVTQGIKSSSNPQNVA